MVELGQSVLTMLALTATTVKGFQGRIRVSPNGAAAYAVRFAKQATSSSDPVVWTAASEGVWRPTVNDVERISWGKPAKQKGTGSRGVPHRLNQDERFLWDEAREKGFLQVRGSGWREERRDAPLLNSYRSLCDARKQVCIVLHKETADGVAQHLDSLLVDLSPLRNPESFDTIASYCLDQHDGGEMCWEPTQTDNPVISDTDPGQAADDQWKTHPIYRLPYYTISWKLPRSDAKRLGKSLAAFFDTAEGRRAASRKPVGVKPGKNRRHGGYGIG